MAASSAVNNGSSCEGREWTHAWPLFLLSSAAFPVVIGSFLFFWRLRHVRLIPCCRKPYHVVDTLSTGGESRDSVGRPSVDLGWGDEPSSLPARIKHFCAFLTSSETFFGRALYVMEFLAGMTIFIIYLHSVSRQIQTTEICAPWDERTDWQIELGCNLFLLSSFLLRFIAATYKLHFMFQLFPLVDYLTIPSSFIALAFHRNWIGLRFLRACHLLSVPHVLHAFDVIKSRAEVRLVHLCCVLLTILLVSSGMFHLIENTGDGWIGFDTVQHRSYWDFVYLCVITLSTIGYGDVTPQTTLGKVFCCLFVVGALAFFGSTLPEVFLLVSRRRRYGGSYKRERGTGHVVVAGHLSAETMQKIIDDFGQKDRKRNDLRIVFVYPQEPDPDMDNLIKRNSATVLFLQGSLLKIEDLRRAVVEDCLACLFVTSKVSTDPDKTDSALVMLVTSVKNYNPRTRCIVQLLRKKTKTLLLSIPSFHVKRGDTLICYQEFELSLAAQGCLAPGSATLLGNLMHLVSDTVKLTQSTPVLAQYFRGCRFAVHCGAFSPHFYSLKFAEAAVLCFTKLDILLIGLFSPQRNNNKPGLLLAPFGDTEVNAERIGIFIAGSAVCVSRAHFYCDQCHRDILNPSWMKPCRCGREKIPVRRDRLRNPLERLLSLTQSRDISRMRHSLLVSPPPGWEDRFLQHARSRIRTKSFETLDSDCPPEEEEISLDYTGCFYCRRPVSFRSVFLDKLESMERSFRGHILVLIMAHPGDPRIGLEDLILPLRCSRIPLAELKEVVLLGNRTVLEAEWPHISSLPKITAVNGDPLNRTDLRAVSLRHCSMCVVLSAWTGTSVDPTMDDRAAVLSTLNVRAMPFEVDERYEVVDVPTITAIQHDVNIRLLSEYDHRSSGREEIYLTEPYMCGQSVSISALDSMLVTSKTSSTRRAGGSYVMPLAVPVMQALLYGFRSPLMDTLEAEGAGLIAGDLYSAQAASPYTTSIELVGITEGRWTIPKDLDMKDLRYGALFEVMARQGALCLGISRKLLSESEELRRIRRCVITNPAKDFLIQSDDLVYVLRK